MKTVATASVLFLAAAAAQSVAQAVGINGVRAAWGITGPMCPSLLVRLTSTMAYLALLAVLVGAIALLAGWVSGSGRATAGRTVLSALFGTVIFVGAEVVAFQLPPVRAAMLKDATLTNGVIAWGHALVVGCATMVSFVYGRGGPTRGCS